MKKILFTLIIVFSCSATAIAQTNEVVTLNEISSEVQYKTNESAKTYYKLNEEYLSSNRFREGMAFRFATGVETNQEFEITRVSEYHPGYLSVIAKEKGMIRGL